MSRDSLTRRAFRIGRADFITADLLDGPKCSGTSVRKWRSSSGHVIVDSLKLQNIISKNNNKISYSYMRSFL